MHQIYLIAVNDYWLELIMAQKHIHRNIHKHTYIKKQTVFY